jgi:U1 small nuclear ribonucleoprotein 70kDa
LLINVYVELSLTLLSRTAAYKDAEGLKLMNKRLLIDVERGRTVKGWKPRRLAGGLGGRPKKAVFGESRVVGRLCSAEADSEVPFAVPEPAFAGPPMRGGFGGRGGGRGGFVQRGGFGGRGGFGTLGLTSSRLGAPAFRLSR